MSRLTDTKYLRWASLFMMCATFLDEIRSRPFEEGKFREETAGAGTETGRQRNAQYQTAALRSTFVSDIVNTPASVELGTLFPHQMATSRHRAGHLTSFHLVFEPNEVSVAKNIILSASSGRYDLLPVKKPQSNAVLSDANANVCTSTQASGLVPLCCPTTVPAWGFRLLDEFYPLNTLYQRCDGRS